MSQKISEKVRRKKRRENITKKSAEKNPLNLGKKSQNPEKNCRDFLIPKIFVRFFQSNIPLDSTFNKRIAKGVIRNCLSLKKSSNPHFFNDVPTL
jgi:hypothetical protein